MHLRFYDSSDSNVLSAEANIVSPLNLGSSAVASKEPVMEEGRVYMACPQVGCSVVVDDEKALRLIKKEAARRRYRRPIIKSFIDILHLSMNAMLQCSRLLRWCPGVDSGRMVKVAQEESRPVNCKCGTVFCFSCGYESHEPVNCRLLSLWLKKCKYDSEMSNWISANTKECPRCQKGGGCNHVTCKNAACKVEFCWVCLGPWEPHGNSWYSCNHFDDSLAEEARDVQESSRAALQRYLHHYSRFMNHQHSLKLENKVDLLFFSVNFILLGKSIGAGVLCEVSCGKVLLGISGFTRTAARPTCAVDSMIH
ncbi:unnamed protein product [Toxocara canis]|uniref:RBR-type E3 ubiquitin transferase n=1 Tax=Toxocara canis TaxID=6265 RepID=A0A183UQR2_TOXCA|nr:unnamed protein product [Toxocara canis]